jgi:hypothetical protein
VNRGRAARAGLLALGYLALALLFTHPLAGNLGTHHVGEAGGDAKVYLWNYWWTKTALSESTSPFETDRIFHPIGIGLAFHTLGVLQGIEFIPLSLLAGDVAGANLVLLWTFLASALFTYALARHAGASVDSAFLAGMVFAFCPYRLARLAGHYDLLGTEWIPLYALLILKLSERKRWSAPLAIASGAALAACGYTSLTYLVFLALFTALAIAFRRGLLVRAAAAGMVALFLLSPLLIQAHRDRTSWTYLRYPGADRYSADLASYLVPSPKQTLLGPGLGRAFDDNLTESTVFAGWIAAAFACYALFRRKRIPGVSFWLVSSAVFFVLSLGSSLRILGGDSGIPLPFQLLAALPLLDNLRAPSRFAIMVMLGLAVILALAWSQVSRSWRFRSLAAAGLGALLALEYLALPTPLFLSGANPVYARIAVSETATVVEIPGIEQAPVETMYHQTIHEKPIFVGTAARVPTEKSDYYLGLPLVRPLIELRKGRLTIDSALLERERESAPHVARFLDLGYIVVDRDYEKRGVVAFVEAVLPVERWYEDESLVVLRTRRSELPGDPSVLQAGSAHSRQHFESGWLRPESEGGLSFRWADRKRSTILFRRPSSRVRSLTLVMAPLEGIAQSISIDLDGRSLPPRALHPGWQDVVVQLPEARAPGAVERLRLRWASLAPASERDPRRLAARVREVRLE